MGHMVAQEMAPAIPRLSVSENPSVHPSADVHEFSFLEGEVHIGASVFVAPGTAVTAELGAAVAIAEGCALLPGVIISGVAGAQVTSPAIARNAASRDRYSVWVGDRTVVSHKSMIHSPAFIGKDCFIGLRSTIFNARLGDGCVVMMHALVQDVEIPPGKCVPSGSVITTQHQADQLPQVRPQDLEFSREIAGIAGRNVRSATPSHAQNSSKARLVPISSRSQSSSPPVNISSSHPKSASPPDFIRPVSNYSTSSTFYATEGANMQAQRLSPDTVQQVRQYLSQGYRIGMEHADTRRYRSGVWETCTPIKDTREQAVFEALERCLAEHRGEYVRMFGIDPAVKRRVGMVTVQRPGDQPVSSGNAAPNNTSFGASRSYSPSNNGGGAAGALSPEVVQEVRGLLNSGHLIGTEHADARHYRSNVWKSCSPIASRSEQEVMSRLQHCLDEHSGEFVRMFGIDPKAKSRTASKTIQRADGKPVDVSPSRMASVGSSSQGYQAGYPSTGASPVSGGHNGEATQVVSQILSQGGQIGVEVADARRYRSGIWQTAPSMQSVGQLQNFLGQNPDKYVRIFSVNKAMKTRGSATTVQKPGQAMSSQGGHAGSQGRIDPINANPPHYDDPAFLKTGSYGNSGNGSGAVDSEVMNQVTQLVNQGCRIAVEFADKRRYRSGIWQTGPAIDARRPAEVISALGQQLAQHQGDYVRLVGVDPVAKRRVLETTIQRP